MGHTSPETVALLERADAVAAEAAAEAERLEAMAKYDYAEAMEQVKRLRAIARRFGQSTTAPSPRKRTRGKGQAQAPMNARGRASVLRVAEAIQKHWPDADFGSRELREVLGGVPDASLQTNLRRLRDLQVVRIVEGGAKPRYRLWDDAAIVQLREGALNGSS